MCVFIQVTTLYVVQVSGLLSVWLLQFCNSMILGSLVLSFIVAALFVRHCQVCVCDIENKSVSFRCECRELLLLFKVMHRKIQTVVAFFFFFTDI